MSSDGVLEGKVVVLVGAGAIGPGWSNGRACAVTYARAGATVVCVDRQIDSAAETVRIITEEGGRALALEADATSEDDLTRVIDRTCSELNRIDVMHNNVGVGGSGGTPEDIPLDLWRRELDQNLTSAYLGIRCVAPVMRRQGSGAITNTSSLLAVRFLRRPTTAYSTAKAAVEALTRACAASYGRDGIRVNCLRIGFSETPLVMQGLQALTEEQRQAQLAKSRAKVPLRQEHGDPFDVANAALYLASDAARHVTGVILSVDGGLSCAPL